jgi:primosomal protein N'
MTRGSVLDRPPGGGPVRGVVLPDLDGALRRPTLDAAEDALRLAFRVAGWTAALPLAERGTGPSVVVETRDADHHALRALVDWDAEAFWLAEAELRRPLDLPPHRPAIRIEAASAALLGEIRTHLAPGDGLVGPLPLDRGRIAMLVRSSDRPATLSALRPLRDRLSRQGVELRVDVDPVDLG